MPARRRRRAPLPRLTLRDVQQRARAAGITLPAEGVDAMLDTMNNALAPLRDPAAAPERTREPAVIFRP